mmetsp:Transcript_39362/g.85638  ORF Transcript_39362/g.85638 Transcript_39362/m.85638 type:complete len:546 (-) Transcript_39362:146-1783(-)
MSKGVMFPEGTSCENRHNLSEYIFNRANGESKAPISIITAWNDSLSTAPNPNARSNPNASEKGKCEGLYTPKGPAVYGTASYRTPSPSNHPSTSASSSQAKANASPGMGHWRPHWWRIADNPAYMKQEKEALSTAIARVMVRTLEVVVAIALLVLAAYGIHRFLHPLVPKEYLRPSFRDANGYPRLVAELDVADADFNSTADDVWLSKSSPDLGSLVVVPQPIAGDGHRVRRWTIHAGKQAAEIVKTLNNTHNFKRVLLVGDEYFETWEGTRVGGACDYGQLAVCREVAMLFNHTYSRAEVLFSASAGDTAENVLWRWSGVKKSGMRDNACGTAGEPNMCASPAVIVVHAGSNDLSLGRSPEVVAAGVRALLLALRNRFPRAHMVLTALLPRADDIYTENLRAYGIPTEGGRLELPQNFTRLSYRDSKFYRRIKRINAWLKLAAQEAGTWENPVFVDESPPVTYHDCGPWFVRNYQIPAELMPDMHRLSVEGHKIWMQCVHQVVSKLWQEQQLVSTLGAKNFVARPLREAAKQHKSTIFGQTSIP